MAKDALVDVLKGLLNEVTALRFHGGSYAKLTQAQGLADGYMRALMDAGLVDAKTLLKVVSEERARFVSKEETSSNHVVAA